VIKTLEAQVGQFLLGCKCPVSRFLPSRAKNLSAPMYYEVTWPFGQKVVKTNQQVDCTLEGDNVRYLLINVSIMVEFCEFRLVIASEIKLSCSLTLQTGVIR
jgi:hypothetical protein